MGVSGTAAARFLLRQGALVTGVDHNCRTLCEKNNIQALMKKGVMLVETVDPSAISSFEKVIVSPGVPQGNPYYVAAKKAGIEILGEAELGLRGIKNPAVAVTGTNGKTTVSLLVGHVLRFLGREVRVLGNIGVPITEEVLNLSEETTLVVELSSFQLETLSAPVFDAAVILNITPDHLDRYSCMEEYAAAKVGIARCLRESGTLFMGEEAYLEFGTQLRGISPVIFGKGKKSLFRLTKEGLAVEENIIPIFSLVQKRGGSLHQENIVAAYALCSQLGVIPEDFLEALPSFTPPAHRMEYVKTIDGVSYYNDSKGTNVDAVIKAVTSLEGEVIVIAKRNPITQNELPPLSQANPYIRSGDAKERTKTPVFCFENESLSLE